MPTSANVRRMPTLALRVILILTSFLWICGAVARANVESGVFPSSPRPSTPISSAPYMPTKLVGEASLAPAVSNQSPENDLPHSEFHVTTTPTDTPTNPTPTNLTPTTAPSISLVADPLDLDSLAFHRHEHARLEAEQLALVQSLREAQVELELLEFRLTNEQRYYEETHASTIVQNALPSPRGAIVRQLECEGWKKTGRCSARDARRPVQDRSCLAEIQGGAAGYCEVRDATTGEFFKVMRVDCASVRTTAFFWCELAPQFANLPADIERAVVAQQHQEELGTPSSAVETQGIVLTVRASQVHQLERLLRVLRSLGCTLPIEIWYFPTEMAASPNAGGAWPPTDRRSELRPFTTLPFTATATRYTKIHAVVHSHFAHLLYLDVGVVPLRDPTYLFSLPEFQSTGAVFWPDVVHPNTPDSHVVETSLLWELLDMPFVSMFEQDDRQLLLNRNLPSVRTALRVLELFAAQRPSLFAKLELVQRTKDYARLAWLKTRAPFHVVAMPPTLGGSVLADKRFCGTHVVQHDPSGNTLFVHRQIQSDDDDVIVETVNDMASAPFQHVQEFDWRQKPGDGTATALLNEAEMMIHYDVRSFKASVRDQETKCMAHASQTDRITTVKWNKFPPTAFASTADVERY